MELIEKIQRSLSYGDYIEANRISLHSAEPGRVCLKMEICPANRNIYGVAHGGALYGLADTAAGITAGSLNHRVVTQSSNFEFLGNTNEGFVYAEGSVLHDGRQVCVVQMMVKSEAGKLLCAGTFNMFRVDRPTRAERENAGNRPKSE